MRVLFFVEGFTDIRFVVGLSRICDLTLAVPTRTYESSGLKRRVAESGARLAVREIPGGRLGFQVRSVGYLLRRSPRFDVVLAQEVSAGPWTRNLAGRLRGGAGPELHWRSDPATYFRCRRERRQIAGLAVRRSGTR